MPAPVIVGDRVIDHRIIQDIVRGIGAHVVLPILHQLFRLRLRRANRVEDNALRRKELRCKETGEEKTILFGLTGTGYFDLKAYEQFNNGTMTDSIPTDADIAASLAQLPKMD